MRKITLVVACLVCVGHGRRTQLSAELLRSLGASDSQRHARAYARLNSSEVLKTFLLKFNPSGAFKTSSLGRVRIPSGNTALGISHSLAHDRWCPTGYCGPVGRRCRTPTLQTFSSPSLPQIGDSLLPIIAVIRWCLLGMIPAGILALQPKRSQMFRRVFTGCALGVVVSLWIFSGTYGFLTVFSLMAIIAQNEYFAMARENGCYPTWKLGTLGSIGMYIAACSPNPVLRDALFPLTGTMTIVYLMLRRSVIGFEKKTPALTMNDVSTTFMGIYYFGYMPSFWVRMHKLGPLEPSAVLSQLLPAGAAAWKWPIVSKLAASSADIFTCGALVQWWTMFAIVAADVFAYFVGKNFGKTPFVELSPRKTLEGLVGGCAGAMVATTTGAKLMGWPRPLLSGICYGLLCSVMALIGDLTVSLLKRSAGFKDTGRLLPGHGGLLDRIDSYLLVPAPAYFYVRWMLPLYH